MVAPAFSARDEESDGAGFTDVELRDTMILMINAGYETTVNVIGQAIFAMLTSPDRSHLVRRRLWGGQPPPGLARAGRRHLRRHPRGEGPAGALGPVPTLISNGHRELPVYLRAVE
jgi:cytochrome P450